MKATYRHKASGAILTDVIVSQNFVNLTGNLVSIRYEDEPSYRTYEWNSFHNSFEEVVKSAEGTYVTLPTQGYLVFLHIIPSLKRIDLSVNLATLNERDKGKIFFISKSKALSFFDDVIKLYPDYELITKDSGD